MTTRSDVGLPKYGSAESVTRSSVNFREIPFATLHPRVIFEAMSVPDTKLAEQLDKDIDRITGLLQENKDDIRFLRDAVTFLRTSSAAGYENTVVAQSILKFEEVIDKVEGKTGRYEEQVLRILRKIQHDLEPKSVPTPTSISFAQKE